MVNNDEGEKTGIPASAAEDNDLTRLKYYIADGEDVNRSWLEAQPPLSIAARAYNVKAMELLIENGANVNVTSEEDGSTPLHWAAKYELEGTRLLLANGADINAKNHKGNTPLFYALWSAWGEKSIETIKLLIDNGADVHTKNNARQTPLEFFKDERSRTLIDYKYIGETIAIMEEAENSLPLIGTFTEAIVNRRNAPTTKDVQK
jgi:ankyrin repeat protein